jgi:hypothetical protein
MGLRTGLTKNKTPATINTISLSSVAPTILAAGKQTLEAITSGELQKDKDASPLPKSLLELSAQFSSQSEVWRQKFIYPRIKEDREYLRSKEGFDEFTSEMRGIESIAPHWVAHAEFNIGNNHFDMYIDGEASTGDHQDLFTADGNPVRSLVSPTFFASTTVIRNGTEVSHVFAEGINSYAPVHFRGDKLALLNETYAMEKLAPYFTALVFFTPSGPSNFEYLDAKTETWTPGTLVWEAKTDDEIFAWRDRLKELTEKPEEK